MPLVFVHGVNVRKGDTPEAVRRYEQGVETRNRFLRTISMAGLVPPPATLHIESPYWGDHAARFAYDLASVPAAGAETFGPSDDVMAQVVMETVPYDVAFQVQATPGGESSLLLTLARTHSLMAAVDAIVAAAAVASSGVDDPVVAENSQELAVFAAQAAVYAAANPEPAWLDAINPATGDLRLQSDSDFLEALAQEVKASAPAGGPETFGISEVLDRLKQAAQKMAGAAQKTVKVIVGSVAGAGLGAVGGAAAGGAPGALVKALRPLATQRAGIFFGDVFVYLATRGTQNQPGPIVQVIADALASAVAHKTAQDDKLVVVAHSMGGNIVYDILTHYRPDISVDLLVTAGSQIGLFKELSLYQEDAPTNGGQSTGGPSPIGNTPPPRVTKPVAVDTWLNIFDPMDVLGFAAEGVFKGVQDYAFSNQANPLTAHNLYYFRPAFHHRLRARMAEAGFGSTP